jgi:Tfp pilus assembly protein PilF
MMPNGGLVITSQSTKTFARKLQGILANPDCKIVWFLGAGCSISSGIPGASQLVERWLPRLKILEEESDSNWQEWAKERFPELEQSDQGKSYGSVINALFPTSIERQHEIEQLTSDKYPSIGYALLALLSTHTELGPRSNIILTTNFDDLVADGHYLMSRPRPVVVPHESLAGFVRASRIRPLVVKVHGDARLAPLNTSDETATLDATLIEKISLLFAGCTLIFVGYGGNDRSIRKLLEAAPSDGFQGGVFWVGTNIPNNPVGEWLSNRANSKNDVFHVEDNDFDHLFVQLSKTLNLEMPSMKRFAEISQSYSDRLEMEEYSPAATISKGMTSRPSISPKSVYANTLASRAHELERSDLLLAKELYEESLRADPELLFALGSYANFLARLMKDPPRAKVMYERALLVDPDHPITLGNYANFLVELEKNFPLAKEMYERAIVANPNNANTLINYANFLAHLEKNFPLAKEMYVRALEVDPFDAEALSGYGAFLALREQGNARASEMFERALTADPHHSVALGRYATFLAEQVKDFSKAKEMFERARAADPNHAVTNGNYAAFLADQERDYPRAKEMYEQALAADPHHPGNLGNYANYLFTHEKNYQLAREMYEQALTIDPENPVIVGNYAAFLAIHEKDYPRAKKLYEQALALNPHEAGTLGNYASFLRVNEKDYDRAKELYQRALAVDPHQAVNLGNYAAFLADIEENYPLAKETYEQALAIDPQQTANLGNYAAFLVAHEKDYQRAKELYERALAVDPQHPGNLGNYAAFLTTREKDYQRAKELYERALAIDPDNTNNLGNHAQILLAFTTDDKERSELIKLVERVKAMSNVSKSLRLELSFYQLVHQPESNETIGPMIFQLISEGERSLGWNFEPNLTWAKTRFDIRLVLLTQLANVISGIEDVTTLVKYPDWERWGGASP